MKKISKVYLDLDSTLANLLTYVCNEVNKMYGLAIELYPEMIDSYSYFQNEFGDHIKSIWSTPGIYDNHIKPLLGACEFIESLEELVGKENIAIITSGPTEVREEKTRFCKEWFDIDNVLHESTKWPHCIDGVLIDDYIHHIDGHIINNKNYGILFNYSGFYPYAENKNYENKYGELFKYSETYNDIIKILSSSIFLK